MLVIAAHPLGLSPARPLRRRPMEPSTLRIALFSGNYNYVRDGANQALNRLVGYLLRQGAAGPHLFADGRKARRSRRPASSSAFPPSPSPAAPEYRLPLRIPRGVRRDLAAFAPNVVHVASPDIVAHRAVSWARRARHSGRRLGPHPVRNLSRLLSSADGSSRWCARSCAASTAAATRSSRRPNRPPRSSAPSA